MHVPALKHWARLAFAATCFGVLSPATSVAAESADVWSAVRASLFGERPIADAGSELSLAVPKRAEDAAVVPVAIRAAPVTGRGAPRKLYLVIDANPSPVSAAFEFGTDLGIPEIETRVRVEDNSTVRVIAEHADGSLSMTTRMIKASGGCSAPANRRDRDRNTLGHMQWLLPETSVAGEPVAVTLLIRHPNTSGLAMDQMTRLYEPPHFVRQVRVTYAGRLVWSADVDFSVSENPAFRFAFVPPGPGRLTADVIDSNGLAFQGSVDVGASTP